MNLLEARYLGKVARRRREHDSAGQEREYENDAHTVLEPVDRAPQRIPVGPDPSSDPLDERHPQSCLGSPVPRPSHHDSIPAGGGSHPPKLGMIRSTAPQASEPGHKFARR